MQTTLPSTTRRRRRPDRPGIRPVPALVGSPSNVGTVPLLKVMYLFAGKRRHSDIGSVLRDAEKAGKIRLELA